MPRLSRREALATGAVTLAGAAALAARAGQSGGGPAPSGRVITKARVKQSVCWWPYQRGGVTLPDFCAAISAMGLSAIDLLREAEWPVARDHGLVCSMAYAGVDSIPNGFNNKANHDSLVTALEDGIPKAAAAKLPNVIAFFGNRRGISDSEGIDNCVEGLNRVKQVAEEHNVTLCVELLNSKVDHKDYQGDHTAFGVAVVKAVNSPRVKLLYDIYHMQIMEGDVIRTMRENRDWIAHLHTGGVPGRHELDNSQELNWAAISTAVATLNVPNLGANPGMGTPATSGTVTPDQSFQGYMAHEFVPTRDPMTSLKEALTLCDV